MQMVAGAIKRFRSVCTEGMMMCKLVHTSAATWLINPKVARTCTSLNQPAKGRLYLQSLLKVIFNYMGFHNGNNTDKTVRSYYFIVIVGVKGNFVNLFWGSNKTQTPYTINIFQPKYAMEKWNIYFDFAWYLIYSILIF